MAPDVAKKAPKMCKKYAYTEHSKYSQWEKERRARFSDRLEELSRAMPGYNKENPWKKIEIVEQAIANINSKQLGISKAHEDSVKKLSAEVHQLKTVILRFTNFKKGSSEDIFSLTSTKVVLVLEQVLRDDERNKENQAPEEQPVPDPDNEESLAFVAKIAKANDHSYSLATAEVSSLEVDGEEVVETVEVEQEQEDLQAQPILIDLAELEPPALALPSYITFDPATLPTSLPLVPQVFSLQDLPWPRGKASNVTTIFVNKGSRASLLTTDTLPPTPTKLPIPRLKAPKRTVRPKRARSTKKSGKQVGEKGDIVNEATEAQTLTLDSLEAVNVGHDKQKESSVVDLTESLDELQSSTVVVKDTSVLGIEDLETGEESLPIDKEVIDLQNNEEMEILEETIKEQGERETREKSEKETRRKDGKRKTEKEGENVAVQKKKVDPNKKKSKSSYSIAALCQISVNIGDRPEMANSPGVLSLNSVGTMSPSHTPAPTPTPDPTKSFGMESCGIVIDREENVLEELGTIRPEDVSFETPSGAETDVIKKNVSPSQSFLTHFPAVSKGEQEDTISVVTKTIQRDIYQALKDLDKELNLDSEGLDNVSTVEARKASETKKVASSPTKPPPVLTTSASATVSRYLPSSCSTQVPPSTSSSALSVYDFSATKPETPPIPLQKARAKEGRREEGQRAGEPPYKNPEKKIYTEMQSKPKKAAAEVGKVKEGGSNLQHGQPYHGSMEYQQQGKVQAYHQPPSSYQARHQMTAYMAPHYYQGMGPLQQQHYHHAPHHPYPPVPEPELKGGQAPHRYSCSSHAYLPAPNYHHYPSAPKHYPQGQAWTPHQAPQGYPKPSRDRQGMEGEAGREAPPQAGATTFTVTQLVSGSQRKAGTKRPAKPSQASSAKMARVQEQGAKEPKDKEDCRKGARSGAGSRRNKSGSGRSSTSYSAESLMLPSSAVLTMTADSKETPDSKVKTSPAKKESSGMGSSSRGQATSNSWGQAGDHFSLAQFSSLSPSPANLFPPDLSSLDFPMTMFGGSDSKDYTLPSSSQPNPKTPGKQQACQRAAVASVADWSLNSSELFLPPLPTLTPPGDPMADPMASYNFMSPMPHGHYTSYSCSAPQGRAQGQPHSYSAHSAANIPTSGYSASAMVMTKPGSSQPFPPSQVRVLTFTKQDSRALWMSGAFLVSRPPAT